MTKDKKTFLLFLPALFVIVGLFLGGIFLSFLQSVGYFPIGGENSFTLAHYAEILGDREIRLSFILTFLIASITTLLSAVCGVALAILLRKFARTNSFLKTLLQVPLAIPHLAAALILINIISPSGLLARIFYLCGIINAPNDFPVLVNDAYGIGIVLSYVLKETPFVALMVLAVLTRIGDELEQVAENLGASILQRFRFVTLPLIAPTVIFASLIVFAFVFGAFEVPFVLGRPFPAMLAVVLIRRFGDTDLNERPAAMALAMLMLVVAGLFVWLYLRLTKNFMSQEKPPIF